MEKGAKVEIVADSGENWQTQSEPINVINVESCQSLVSLMFEINITGSETNKIFCASGMH